MKKLLLLGIMLLGMGGVTSVKAQGGTKTPLLLLKNGAINSSEFEIKPIPPSTLTTENLYAATFTSTGGYCNTFQYKEKPYQLDVSDYDKAVVKYTIEPGNGDWQIFLPNGTFTALPIGKDQVYEVDLTDVNTYGDFTVFSWNHSGKSITISEVYLYKSSFVEFEFDAFGKGTVDKSKLTATGGLTYDPSTGALSSDGTAGSLVLEFATPVDMRNLFQFNVANSGQTGDILSRLEFYDEDNVKINTWNGIKLGNLSYENGIDDHATNAFLNNKPVKKMVWPSDANASNNGKTATITSVAFTCKTIACAKAGETILKNLPWNKIDGSGTATPDWNMNVSTDTYYGDYSGNPTHYTDLTAYKELRIYRDNNDGFRAFFINAAGTGTNTIANDNVASTWNAEGKYWSVDLGKIEKWDSKIALKSIKSASSGTNNIVKNIVVYDASATNDAQYVFVGEGILSPAAQAALEDATVTIIDATGVTGTGVTLTPANPNTIFKANAGVLANTKNVMVGTTIANLELTDGYPFAVPSGATATAATYTRSMSNKYGTVCLPYAVASTDAVKYYTIESLAANELTLKAEATLSAGTPAIVEMVSGSSITATGSGALAEAGAPTDNLKLIGTYEAKTILASDYAGKGIYAISNNQFVQATNSINLPAFRAFFTAAPAESNIRLVFDDDATAIDALSGEGDVTIEGIYSLDGAEMPSLQKGINVVKFSNGEVKKVIVK